MGMRYDARGPRTYSPIRATSRPYVINGQRVRTHTTMNCKKRASLLITGGGTGAMDPLPPPASVLACMISLRTQDSPFTVSGESGKS